MPVSTRQDVRSRELRHELVCTPILQYVAAYHQCRECAVLSVGSLSLMPEVDPDSLARHAEARRRCRVARVRHGRLALLHANVLMRLQCPEQSKRGGGLESFTSCSCRRSE